MDPKPCFGLLIGNGCCIKEGGVCKRVKLEMQGCPVIQNFYPFGLGVQIWY